MDCMYKWLSDNLKCSRFVLQVLSVIIKVTILDLEPVYLFEKFGLNKVKFPFNISFHL